MKLILGAANAGEERLSFMNISESSFLTASRILMVRERRRRREGRKIAETDTTYNIFILSENMAWRSVACKREKERQIGAEEEEGKGREFSHEQW